MLSQKPYPSHSGPPPPPYAFKKLWALLAGFEIKLLMVYMGLGTVNDEIA